MTERQTRKGQIEDSPILREPIGLPDLDLVRGRVRCPRCVARLLALLWGGLLCEGCLRAIMRVSPGGGRRIGPR